MQNADIRKDVVAFGQTYFAVQTRKMELTEDYFKLLDENKKRLITRGETIAKNKTLYKTAKESGVVNYGKSTLVKVSTVSLLGLLITINLLCVRISNCSN